MATIAFDAIIRRVRTILDYNSTSDEIDGLGGIGTLDLDIIIKESIEPAAMQLMQIVPIELATITCKRIDEVGDYPYAMPLPQDYLRFVSCRMSNWHAPIVHLTEMGSKEHIKQYGEFEALKATNNKPVAVLESKGNGRMVLSMFGGECHTWAECHYIGIPQIEEKTETIEGSEDVKTEIHITITNNLCEPLCYIVATIVCEVLKDTQKSKVMMETAQGLLLSVERLATANNNIS